MYSTSLPRPAIFAGLGKTISNTFLFKNIRKNRVDFEDLGEFYRRNLVRK